MPTLMQFYWTAGLMAFSGGIGFYVGNRGLAGVKIDIDNIKTDIENVKTAIQPKAAKVVTPVGSPKSTDTTTVTTTPSK